MKLESWASDVFMTLFTPRQTTPNKTIFIERWSDYKKNVTGALIVTLAQFAKG